jgi:hypothetical protein
MEREKFFASESGNETTIPFAELLRVEAAVGRELQLMKDSDHLMRLAHRELFPDSPSLDPWQITVSLQDIPAWLQKRQLAQ